MIDELDIRRIKDAASIKDVMEDYGITLRKSGAEYECLCPFHDDHHLGSFKVSIRRNIYHCFSCGAQGGPTNFLMEYAGMTFPDAIRYLGAKYGISVEGSENFHPKPAKPHKPAPALPMLVLPQEYIHARRDLSNDILCNWMRSLPWNEEQRERLPKVLKNYLVGHSNDGHTIYWQMDQSGRLRTGKMMRYKPDGHRDKESKGNFSWIHARLEAAGKYDPNKQEMCTTFFGMHLIDYYPKAVINIVESEKTALICATYFGNSEDDLWIASGGLYMLTRERMMPLIERGRSIVLYPDHDAFDKWQKQAEAIGYDAIKVHKAFVERNWTEADGPKADIADILVRMLYESTQAKRERAAMTIQEMVQKNPNVQLLIDNLKLQPIIEA